MTRTSFWIHLDDDRLVIRCERCGEVVESYTEFPIDIDQLIGDAYSDHMHEDD